MLKLEIKRILKTRATWWLTALALALCLLFAFMTVRRTFYDENSRIVRGAEAYELIKEKYSVIEGEVTPELVAEAVRVYHEVIAEYGDDYSVPPEVSSKILGPYSPVYTWVSRAFTDENGINFFAMDITPEQAQNFYRERLITLGRTLETKYEKQPQVLEYAMSRADSGENFNYSYGIGSTYTFDDLGMCTFLVTLICSLITAPIFSSDYASGADDILRCTRRGRKRLALTKLCSATIISLGIFILCIGAFLVVVYMAYGFDDCTSAELLNIVWNPDSLTAVGCMGLILLSSLISFFAMSCFTLFLSSRLSSPLAVLAVSIAVAIIPTVILISGADGNALNWIRFCLPSGGVMSAGAMLYELASLRFLWIGDFVTWSPYVMLVAAAVQIPIWFGLTVRAYDRHEAA